MARFKSATVSLVGESPYSQAGYYDVPMLDRELKADYEKRTWRERLHVNSDGYVYIPAMAFKNCIAEAAKYMSIQIKGKGKATYTKHFESGIIVDKDAVLDIKKDDVDCEKLFVPSDGVRGSGKRVIKYFPVIRQWKADVHFIIADQIITEEVFQEHLEAAGLLIGIGRFRPRRNGYYGRFAVENIVWGTM